MRNPVNHVGDYIHMVDRPCCKSIEKNRPGSDYHKRVKEVIAFHFGLCGFLDVAYHNIQNYQQAAKL